jgi:hypothetical protein
VITESGIPSLCPLLAAEHVLSLLAAVRDRQRIVWKALNSASLRPVKGSKAGACAEP